MTCSVEDCGRPIFAKLLCNRHYKKQRRHGDPTYERPKPRCSVDDCEDPYLARGLCNTHYLRQKKRGTLERFLTADPVERFWEKADRRSGDECWPWTAHVTRKGYGMFKTTSGLVGAHRHAYELATGPIPDGLQIDHVCHTRDKSCPGGDTCPHRRCVNPAHLEPVTQAVNTERGLAGTVSSRKTHCPQGHPYSPENTLVNINGARLCRTCNKAKTRARRNRLKQQAQTLV